MYVVSPKQPIFVSSISSKTPPHAFGLINQYFNLFIRYIEKTLMLYDFYADTFPYNCLLVASF